MKLILSTYLRTLKERDEFDALLPELLVSMGIVPLTKPQIGTRQFGVDLSAVGPDPDDEGKSKLHLFVIKRGDIGRREWDTAGPQSIRPSINEILDVYLKSHVEEKYKSLQRKVILASTGDLKEEIQQNWVGFKSKIEKHVQLDFWGADKVAILIENQAIV